jgi:hypothetical protein
LHDGNCREDQRRVAAIADRKALAAEAVNYARVLTASTMRDPAKAGVTGTGLIPQMLTPLEAGPADPGGQPGHRGSRNGPIGWRPT